MSKKDELLALAHEVELLSQSERDVDAKIACIIGRPLGEIDHWLHGVDIFWEPTAHGWYLPILPDGSKGIAYQSAQYTGSLDAAMLLAPKDWVIGEMSWWRKERSATCHMDNKLGLKACSGAVSLPIALTAASLRARAVLEEA